MHCLREILHRLLLLLSDTSIIKQMSDVNVAYCYIYIIPSIPLSCTSVTSKCQIKSYYRKLGLHSAAWHFYLTFSFSHYHSLQYDVTVCNKKFRPSQIYLNIDSSLIKSLVQCNLKWLRGIKELRASLLFNFSQIFLANSRLLYHGHPAYNGHDFKPPRRASPSTALRRSLSRILM